MKDQANCLVTGPSKRGLGYLLHEVGPVADRRLGANHFTREVPSTSPVTVALRKLGSNWYYNFS